MPKISNKEKKITISQDEEVQVLRKIVHLAGSNSELKNILKEIVSIVNEITKADSVFVYLFGDKKKNLVLKASKVPYKKMLGKINLKAGEGITGWVARENKPVAISKNAYQDKRFKGFDKTKSL